MYFNKICLINYKIIKKDDRIKKTQKQYYFIRIFSGFIYIYVCCDGRPTCITQPFLQQRFEFAHVFEAEVESLEAGDGCLAEVIPIEFSHRQAHVPLQTEHIDTKIKYKIKYK